MRGTGAVADRVVGESNQKKSRFAHYEAQRDALIALSPSRNFRDFEKVTVNAGSNRLASDEATSNSRRASPVHQRSRHPARRKYAR